MTEKKKQLRQSWISILTPFSYHSRQKEKKQKTKLRTYGPKIVLVPTIYDASKSLKTLLQHIPNIRVQYFQWSFKHGSHNFRQTNFKDFSRIFPGQITVFKDYDLFNKSAFFNSFLSTLLAKTRHGVIFPKIQFLKLRIYENLI